MNASRAMTDNKKYYPQVLRDAGWHVDDINDPNSPGVDVSGCLYGPRALPRPAENPDTVLFCMKFLLGQGAICRKNPFGYFWHSGSLSLSLYADTLEQATIDAYIEMKRPEWEAGDE